MGHMERIGDSYPNSLFGTKMSRSVQFVKVKQVNVEGNNGTVCLA